MRGVLGRSTDPHTNDLDRKEGDNMRFRMAIVALATVGAMCVFSGSAGARTASSSNSTDDTTCSSMIINDLQATLCNEQTSTINTSIKYNFIGKWDMVSKKLIKRVHGHLDCFWASGQWTNSVKTVNGPEPYGENSRAKFCWLKHPVVVNGVRYTAVKIAGGLTHSHCYNLAVPPGYRQPRPRIQGPVLDVKSLSNVTIPVNVDAVANSNATVTWNCPGGTLSGGASGYASLHSTIKIKIDIHLLYQSGGKVDSTVKASIEEQIKTSIEATATARAVSHITVSCGSTPPQNTPPSCGNVTTPQNGPGGVYANGETYPGSVLIFGTNGDSLTVSAGAPLGQVSVTSPTTFTSNGTDSGSWTYTSPNDSGDVGKYDQITIYVHDNTTGLTGSCSSGQFVLNAPPPRP